MIRVVLVDDQSLIRMGLRAVLERTADIQVVAEAGNGADAIMLAERERPNVMLIDIQMPVMDGIEAIRQIAQRSALRDIKLIVLTTFGEDDYIFPAIQAGAVGFLLKDIEPDDLRNAIRRVAQGDALMSPEVTRRVMSHLAKGNAGMTHPQRLEGLTEREREVLEHVAKGHNNDEVASALDITPATARTYVSRLLTKLKVRDRAQLVVLAYESGLVLPGHQNHSTP
jgi:DNA-binding NarL/FixJ family response regulator